MTITVYALADSRSQRIEWLLRELNLEYNLELYHRDADSRAPEVVKTLHPAGKFPIIKDGDLVLAESGFIINYLLNKYAPNSDLLGKGEKEKFDVSYGVVTAETNFAAYSIQLYINQKARTKMPWGVATVGKKVLDQIDDSYAAPNLIACLDALQAQVNANNGFYTGGHLTAADIMYQYSLAKVRERNYFPEFDKKWPDLVKYITDMNELYDKSAATHKGLVKHFEDHK